ncbi:energy-coupling factor transporter transmembrane component T family protein [Propionispora hippei]|uniref:Cobalt transport protein n=1 Tax=Propionispora hippei DSM 15287 TaxID=1123003 RepID=A0A1M6L3Y7_9FIRM|nr:energy-coupling factor transporter transmembrane component T [Propionispora hippei]SHJ65955.1 Cobalt transport protein [Propionispora hippei DSM 15287]
MAGTQTMQKTILGYVPLESPIYALHPLVRLTLFVITGVIPLFIEMPEGNLAFLLVILGLFLFSRVDLRKLRVYLPMVFTIGIFILAMYIFFPVGKGEPLLLYQAGWVRLEYHSLMWALSVYIRIVALIYASIFYFSTNRERDILVAFRSTGMPFVCSYFLGLSLRSAGMFLEDYRIIREAEEARGLDTEDMSWTGKIKHFAMYMVPLFTLAIRRSDDISMALFAKGTVLTGKVNGRKRSDYLVAKSPVRCGDIAMISGMLAAFLVFVIFEVHTNQFDISHSLMNRALLASVKGGGE